MLLPQHNRVSKSHAARSKSLGSIRPPLESFKTPPLRRKKIPIRKRLPPPKTTLAAVLLLLGGLILGGFGIKEYFYSGNAHNEESGKAMLILASIMLIRK